MDAIRFLANQVTSLWLGSSSNSDHQGQYVPQSSDTARVRFILVFRLGLPTELADMVIERAEYYPVIEAKYTKPFVIRSVPANNNSPAYLPLITPPLPKLREGKRLKVKKVVFTIESHDQGFGGEMGTQGTYNSSYTWFEASIFRPATANPRSLCLWNDPSVFCTTVFAGPNAPEFLNMLHQRRYEQVKRPDGQATWHVQANRTATNEWETYEVVWDDGDDSGITLDESDAEEEESDGSGRGEGFIEMLQSGDCVGLWTRALYPGWRNHVRKTHVQIMVRN